jgi:hypothetical protein
VTYTDAVILEAGTTYRFAVLPFGGDLTSGRCNMVITATAGSFDQTIPAVPQPLGVPVADNGNGG